MSAPEHFSPKVPNLQLYWDAHSLTTFQQCPRQYQYRIIEGWTSKNNALDLDFGLCYHASMEAADRARFAGGGFEDQAQAALDVILNYPPMLMETKEKNRFTLGRSAIWNLDFYQKVPIRPIELNGKPAVEIPFRFEIDLVSDDAEQFGLCGYLDGVSQFPDAVRPLERKTTGKSLGEHYFQRFSPNTQISTYNLAAKVVFNLPLGGVMVEACQTAVNFSAFERREVRRTPAQIDEFLGEVKYWMKTAERMAKANYWPKNESACFLCSFKTICRKDPSVRREFLEHGDFVQRRWNPLETR